MVEEVGRVERETLIECKLTVIGTKMYANP